MLRAQCVWVTWSYFYIILINKVNYRKNSVVSGAESIQCLNVRFTSMRHRAADIINAMQFLLRRSTVLLWASTLWLFAADLAGAAGLHQGNGISAANIAVIVNDADPLSIMVGDYYKKRRSVPAENIIHVNFPTGRSAMSRMEFQRIKSVVDRAAPSHVQAFALTWTVPYRVDCMSITTAFAAGFDEAFCSKTCGPTRLSTYFNSNSRAPYTDFKLRPAMALAGTNFDEVRKLIDRGVASDRTSPPGTGYLVSTSDKSRNVRAALYSEILQQHLGGPLDLRIVTADFIANKKNVLFYFTGVMHVRRLDTIRFVPGAIGDHLTSAGGNLAGGSQMSSLRWLEAGATGSYGAVVEPCNHPQKFPHPGIVINRYLKGETLIEAYWKSVAWPGQGVFIGEPLASPYTRQRIQSQKSGSGRQ